MAQADTQKRGVLHPRSICFHHEASHSCHSCHAQVCTNHYYSDVNLCSDCAVSVLQSKWKEDIARKEERFNRELTAAQHQVMELNRAKEKEIQRLHAQVAEAQTSSQTLSSSQDPQTANMLQALFHDNANLRQAFENSQLQMKTLVEQFTAMYQRNMDTRGAPRADTSDTHIPLKTMPTTTMTVPTITVAPSETEIQSMGGDILERGVNARNAIFAENHWKRVKLIN